MGDAISQSVSKSLLSPIPVFTTASGKSAIVDERHLSGNGRGWSLMLIPKRLNPGPAGMCSGTVTSTEPPSMPLCILCRPSASCGDSGNTTVNVEAPLMQHLSKSTASFKLCDFSTSDGLIDSKCQSFRHTH